MTIKLWFGTIYPIKLWGNLIQSLKRVLVITRTGFNIGSQFDIGFYGSKLSIWLYQEYSLLLQTLRSRT